MARHGGPDPLPDDPGPPEARLAGADPREVAARRVAELEASLATARAEVERLTLQDPLTGCLNRAGLVRAVEGLRGTNGPIAALVLDCDDFERVNLQLGHATGDLVLRDLAGRVREALRPDDLLARVGGDRFLALMPGFDAVEARAVAERVRLAIAWAPFAWEPEPLHLTASIGMAQLPSTVTSVEEVLSIARIALEKSKRRGKNRVSVPEDTSTATQWFAPALRSFMAAVQGGEGLSMHAQAIMGLPEEVATGWEVLVRGPPGPLALPSDLFRMAEEHHLSTALDMFCLRLAVASVTKVKRAGVFHLNVLPTSLIEVPTEQFLALLGAPPDGVTWCVELSEKQFLGDPAELVGTLDRLRMGGVHLAVDDVGSGRGTLDSVVALEPHCAKLDIRLVRGISEDPWRRRFVARLVKMAGALGIEVVAEGIETRADLAVLLDLGVPLGQGYLWGRPGPIEAIAG